MEPVTHMLTGACLSRALGFPKRARYATLACVIAAELPDADYVYRLGGPVTYFEHHRGWTHALWSLPLQAGLVVLLMFGWRYARRAWKSRRRRSQEEAPWRPWLLGCMALVALLSHILLDWTNNYGVRPFAPFNPRWYAGDLVFIVEPVLLVVLTLALVLPLVFSLADSEMGVRRSRFRGQGLAAGALAVMVGLWLWRYDLHASAVHIGDEQQLAGGAVVRVSQNPYPVNPYRWHSVVETANNFTTGTTDTRLGVAKPATTLETLAAKHSLLGRVYLDWSKYPVVEDMGPASEIYPGMDLSPQERAAHVVRFRDLRFGYDVWGFTGRGSRALTGEAWVDGDRQVIRQSFGGAVQR
jgi:inner membrane protein